MQKVGLVGALILLCSAPAFALETGALAPNFSIAKGGFTNLASLKGKVVIVDFWAHWCKPCKKEMPVLEKIYEEYKSKGLVVVGVSVDREEAKMQKFLSELATRENLKVTFPMLRDVDQSIAAKFGPPSMPTSYVIDAKGLVRHVQSGFRGDVREGDGLTLENTVRSLLKLPLLTPK